MKVKKLSITVTHTGLICLSLFPASGCNQEQINLWRAEQIKAGMTFHHVYRIMGRPNVGWGLPQKGSTERSDLYYKIPGDRYLIIHFVGDRADNPPTSIEDRNVLVF